MSIESSIVNRLRTFPSVVAIVGDRIFSGSRPQGHAGRLPAIVYRFSGGSSIDTDDGPTDLRESRFEAECLALDDAVTYQLGDAVKAALDGFREGSVRGVFYENQDDTHLPPIDGSDRGVSMRTVDFQAWSV